MAPVLALVLLSVVALPAAAGPWPRAKGQVFVSTKLSLYRKADGGRLPAADASLYAEYGLGGGWMLGAELNRPRLTHPLPRPEDQTVILYIGGRREVVPIARVPGARPAGLGTTTGEAVLWLGHARDLGHGLVRGWSLGVGRRQIYGARDRSFLRPGLSWGKGFGAGRLPWPGWMSAEMKLELPLGGGTAIPKLDLTFGLRPDANWTLLVEAWIDRYPGNGTGLRLAPAVMRRIGKARVGLQPEIPLRGGGERKLTLALWSEF